MRHVRFSVERAANIAVCAVCVLLAANVVVQLYDRFNPRPSTAAALLADATHKAGDNAPALATAPYGRASATVVLVMKSSCRFCTASMPFYDRLAAFARERQASRPLQLVAVSTESREVTTAYLREHGVALPAVESVSEGHIKAPATPTVLLVDPMGVVRNVWVGRLDAAQEAEVLREIGRLTSRG